MSVRTMTTEAIKKDIQVTMQQWPSGIPPEQEDRMRALYGELKRRGQEAPARLAPEPQLALSDMSDDALGKELQRVAERIGREPGNEELQTRFADVRYEIKNRKQQAPASVVRREIEFDTPETIAQVEPPKPTNGTNGKQELFPGMLKAEPRPNALVLAQIAAKVAGELLTVQTNAIGQINGDDIETACETGVQVAKVVFKRLGISIE